MVKTYARPEPIFVRGAGSYLFDSNHKKYLDMTAGIAVTALGHANREIAEIIQEQVRSFLLFLSSAEC